MQNLFNVFNTFKLWGLKLIGFFFIWFEPAKDSALLLMFLMLVDLIMDIWAKVEKKEHFSFKQLLLKHIKDLTAFMVYILCIHYFQVAYLKETFAIFNVLAGIPIIAVLTGVVENVEKITGISVATKTKEVIQSLFGAITSKALGKKDDEV